MYTEPDYWREARPPYLYYWGASALPSGSSTPPPNVHVAEALPRHLTSEWRLAATVTVLLCYQQLTRLHLACWSLTFKCPLIPYSELSIAETAPKIEVGAPPGLPSEDNYWFLEVQGSFGPIILILHDRLFCLLPSPVCFQQLMPCPLCYIYEVMHDLCGQSITN